MNNDNFGTYALAAYPGTPLRLGSSGDSVRLMQQYLNSIREYRYGTLPYLTEDGIFGVVTQMSVRQYQEIRGLAADGVIGPLTWEAVANEYESLPVPTDAYPGTPLSRSSRGSAVLSIQNRLNTIAQVYTALPQLQADGIFGANTAAAVRLFQRQFGLTVDEVVGSATWQAISNVEAQVRQNTPTAVSTAYPGTALRLGANGDHVRLVQSYLNTIGSKRGNIYPQVTVDGRFGANTRAQVVAFQNYYALTADGVVGPRTWAKLISEFNALV